MSDIAFAIHNAISHTRDVKNFYEGDCIGCGECCSRILPISKHDITRLRAYIKKHGIEQVSKRADVDMLCPYLTDDRRCAVYNARPDICRAYRCDHHASKNFKYVQKFMKHPPYETTDMREVV